MEKKEQKARRIKITLEVDGKGTEVIEANAVALIADVGTITTVRCFTSNIVNRLNVYTGLQQLISDLEEETPILPSLFFLDKNSRTVRRGDDDE